MSLVLNNIYLIFTKLKILKEFIVISRVSGTYTFNVSLLADILNILLEKLYFISPKQGL
jgi:hypothetical protein